MLALASSPVSNNIVTLDRLLDQIAQVAWWILAAYAIIVFILSLRQHGIFIAIIHVLSYRVILPLLVVLAISLVSASMVFIPPDQVGIVVSLLSPGGIRPQPMRAGLHWIFPVLEAEINYPISWQTYTMSTKPTEGQVFGDDSIRARTSDGQEVRLDVSLIFRVDPEQVVSLHVAWQERYTVDLVRPLIRGLVRTQVSQFTVKEVNSSARKDLEVNLDSLLRNQLSGKGLIVDQFILRDITFSAEYAAAIEHKQVALEGEEQALHEAERMRNLANGKADAIETEAQAQAKALKAIGEALKENSQLVTYHYVDKLAPNVRVMLVPSDSPFILPMPDMESSTLETATTMIDPANLISTTLTTSDMMSGKMFTDNVSSTSQSDEVSPIPTVEGEKP